MSQIEELQRRIITAMERIGSGVEALRVTGPAAGGDAALQSALEDERVANAQLEERLKTIKEKHAQEIDALRAQPASDGEADVLRTQLAEATSQLATVEAARAELADAKAALENSDEVAELRAEIESLQSYRNAAGEAESLRAEVSRLRGELADSERLSELSAELEMLRAERASHGAAMSRLDDDLQRLRNANEQLRSAVDELRAAAEEGVADADMLNRATAAELEATRAARASDAAEAHAVLARLEPLLTHANLAEGEVE
ncbi:MAG: hypothetical protein AB3N12_06620 [Ruegeria sp.]